MRWDGYCQEMYAENFGQESQLPYTSPTGFSAAVVNSSILLNFLVQNELSERILAARGPICQSYGHNVIPQPTVQMDYATKYLDWSTRKLRMWTWKVRQHSYAKGYMTHKRTIFYHN